MIPLIKSSMTLLLRKKSFWFFLLLTPMLSILMMRMNQDNLSAYESDDTAEIHELKSVDKIVAYHGGKGAFVIKVYDASQSELSEYMLQRLADSGLFMVCRAKVTEADIADFDRRIEKDGFGDRMGASLVIPKDFDSLVMEEGADAVTLYVLSDDRTVEALKQEIQTQLSRIRENGANGVEVLKEMDAAVPAKKVVSVSGSTARNLTKEQISSRTQMGYAFALLTMGFVFCGILVAHTAIEEQKNGVMTRIRLTRTSTSTYFIAKFVCALIVSLMLTMIMAAGSFSIDASKMGMSRIYFLLMVFLMGVIFSTLSLFFGILIGDVMSANVAAFTVWSLSSMLSGLYFPLNYSSSFIKGISHLMPQWWFVEGTEMIFTGDNGALFMLLCITGAYLAVILSLGGLGLKIRRADEWGTT